jgi:hypothetical protein
MKSRKDDDDLIEQERAQWADEDHLPVPASPARVVIGLVMFVSGLLIAMRWNETKLIWVGLGVFLLSFKVMLKWTDG